MLTSSIKAKSKKIDHFHIDIVVREVMNRQLSVSVAKMKLCFLDCFLCVTVLLLLFVPSQSSLRNDQASEFKTNNNYFLSKRKKNKDLKAFPFFFFF